MRALWRRHTERQIRAFAEAEAFREYTDQRYQWELTRLLVAAAGGRMGEFPDYVSPEEGQPDSASIEANLDAVLERGVLTM